MTDLLPPYSASFVGNRLGYCDKAIFGPGHRETDLGADLAGQYPRPPRNSAVYTASGRMRFRFLLAFLVSFAASCGSSAGPAVATSPSATAVAVVAVADKTVKGQDEVVLTNANGQTLYYLTSDTATTVACSGQCATFWPPLLLPSGQPASGAAIPGKLTVRQDANGTQVLYNGHPLYAFSRDKTGSDANGEGINAFGGTWHVATPALAAM